jgi:type IV secretion system protein VirD4
MLHWRNKDRGFYLGRFVDGNRLGEDVFYPPGNKETNILCIGPNGSGKTTLLVNNAALLRRPLLILDCKGEISAIALRARAKLGPTKVINAWRLLVDTHPHLKDSRFNAIADCDPLARDFEDKCKDSSISLIPDHGGDNAFFSQSSRELTTGTIAHVRIRDGKSGNLAMVRRLITEPYAGTEKGALGFLKTLLEMSGSHCEAVRAKAGRFVTGTKSSQDVISTMINDLGFLDSPAMRDSLSGDGYNWQAFKNSVSTLAIIIPASKLQSHAGYTRLLVSTALRELLSTGPSESVPPTALMLDETPTLGMLPQLIQACAICRGFGVRLMPLVVQDLNQLKALYKDNWPTFVANSGCICSYAPRDVFTAEYLSKLCGQKVVNVASRSINQSNGAPNIGVSITPRYEPLFRPEALMAMPPGRMLVLINGCPPFFTQVPGYWESSFGRGLDPNPYFKG